MRKEYITNISWLDGYSKRGAKIDTRGGRSYIRSYNKIVGYIDKGGKLHRLWNDYSVTTLKHINLAGAWNMSKREWESMKVEKDATADKLEKWLLDNNGAWIFNEQTGYCVGYVKGRK